MSVNKQYFERISKLDTINVTLSSGYFMGQPFAEYAIFFNPYGGMIPLWSCTSGKKKVNKEINYSFKLKYRPAGYYPAILRIQKQDKEFYISIWAMFENGGRSTTDGLLRDGIRLEEQEEASLLPSVSGNANKSAIASIESFIGKGALSIVPQPIENPITPFTRRSYESSSVN